MQELGFINEEEHKSFNKVIRSIKEIRLKDFQYKVTNKILVTKSFLHKINKVDNNICEYCNLQPETIYHLFIECEIVKASLTFKCMTEHLFADFSYSIALDTYL